MRKTISLLLIVCALASPLFAAMTKAAAQKRALALFGPMGRVSTFYNPETRQQVGVLSPGCNQEYTVLGEADSDWSKAFEDFAARHLSGRVVLNGPYSGTLTITPTISDNTVAIQIIVDGIPRGSEAPPGNPISIDTTKLSIGMHVACTRLRNASGMVGGAPAWLFLVEETKQGKQLARL